MHDTSGRWNTLFTQHDFYLYYDANCDWKTGSEHSEHGHPQWLIQAKLPDTQAAFNTDRDGKCFGDTDYAGGYSKEAIYDMVPTGGVQMRKCTGVFGNGPWHEQEFVAHLVGCPQPQPVYTYGDWTAWALARVPSKPGSIVGGCGGGEERRTKPEYVGSMALIILSVSMSASASLPLCLSAPLPLYFARAQSRALSLVLVHIHITFLTRTYRLMPHQTTTIIK